MSGAIGSATVVPMAPPRSGGRLVTAIEAALIAALTIATTTLGSVGMLFLDDLALFTLARGAWWPSPAYLLTPWYGHAMPAGMMLMWFESRMFQVTKLSYGLTQGAAILVCALLLRGIIGRIVGPGAGRLIPLAFFCLSMAVAGAAGWWANAMWLTPLLIVTLLSVRSILSARPDHLQTTTFTCLGLLCAGLLFTEKAALIPIGLYFFEVARRPESVSTAVRHTWILYRRLWLWSLAILTVYLVGYLWISGGFLGTRPFASRMDASGNVLAAVWSQGLPAGTYGGPVVWVNSILTAPPAKYLVYAQVLLMLTVAFSAAAGPGSRRMLIWAGAYVSLTAVLLAGTRFLGDDGLWVVMQVRYYADAVLWFTLALTFAVASWPATIGSRLPATARFALTGSLAAVMVVASVLWTQSFGSAVRAFEGETRATFALDIDAFIAGVHGLPAGSVVLDSPLRDMPFGAIEINTGRPATLSDFYGAFLDPGTFSSSSPTPILYTGQGTFSLVEADGHFARPASPLCLTTNEPEGTILLPAPLWPTFHLARITAATPAASEVQIRLDGEPGGTASPGPGSPTVTTWVEGGEAEVHFTLVDGADTCITSVEVGPPKVIGQLGPLPSN